MQTLTIGELNAIAGGKLVDPVACQTQIGWGAAIGGLVLGGVGGIFGGFGALIGADLGFAGGGAMVARYSSACREFGNSGSK